MPDGSPRREAMLLRIDARSSDTTPLLNPTRALSAVDDVDERLVRGAVGLRPQLLDPRPGERELGALDGGVAQRPGGGSGQCLQLRRQALLDQPGDVDVRIQLIDEIVGRGGPDVRVLEQLGARMRPVVGAEQQAIGPGREDADDQEQGGYADQDVDPDQPPARDLRRRGSARAGQASATVSCSVARAVADSSSLPSRSSAPIGHPNLVASARHHRRCAARSRHRPIRVMPATLARSNIVPTNDVRRPRDEPPGWGPCGRSRTSAPAQPRRR